MSEQASGAVSEAMLAEENKMRAMGRTERANDRKRAQKLSMVDKEQKEKNMEKLLHLVRKSKVYASFMIDRLEKQEIERKRKSEADQKRAEKQDANAEAVAVSLQRKATRASTTQAESKDKETTKPTTKFEKLPTRRRPKKGSANGSITKYLKKEDLEAGADGLTVTEVVAEAADTPESKPTALGAQDLRPSDQPAEVVGGIMRGYQLEGLNWLCSLYENGLNGILADEMGLGKTIQTISLFAHFRSKGTMGPFLVVAPLSTLSNWIEEFRKWTPTIPTVLYHGSPAGRAELRSTKLNVKNPAEFPVVCTSYEICINDRKHLALHNWKYIVIDEGHRLKNLDCRLMRELRQFRSNNRLLITGTPLQNNLKELWSLLHFLMPEIFDTYESFESFIDFSAVLDKDGSEQIIQQERKNSLVTSLHAILKPFLLRRVKTDVETDLPKKREYILWAPLSELQKELYREIKGGNSRAFLEKQVVERIEENTPLSSRSVSLKRKAGSDCTGSPSLKSAKSSRASTPGSVRGRKAAMRKSYAEVSDDDFFEKLEQESGSEESEGEEEDPEVARHLKTLELAKKEIGNKKLQNPIMQLRLACNSPFNFYWPWEDDEIPDSSLVECSGKMIVLDRLVPYLFRGGHKVLIFSQFKTQLDILHDWATLVHKWNVCRIDGAVKQDDRRQQIKDFNTKKNVRLFLLSTRAGGQGINLTAADTVILFDSDWNPQQDLQAQDRAHRIGQTRPVIVYRLATKGTVEQTLLERADGKRRLEKLVIQKGKFRSLLSKDSASEGADMDELAKLLEHDDFEGYDPGEGVLSDEDLKILTDRSEAAFARAEKGLDAGEKFKAVETKRDGDGLLGEMTK